jgi:hypothetical protein
MATESSAGKSRVRKIRIFVPTVAGGGIDPKAGLTVASTTPTTATDTQKFL